MKKILIVPEPKNVKTTGKQFVFDGFENLPSFMAQEFNVSKGSWRITKVEQPGTGIEIKENQVTIWGDENVAYASILQLLSQNPERLPEARIEESFSFKFRGYHLDIARGGVPTVKTFKKILRWLFLLKYNYFAVYFEDLFPWEKHPSIGKHRGKLTLEEWKEITQYGSNLGIEVLPSLELCGHMEQILVLPEYRKYSEWHRPQEGCLDISNEEARKLAYELLEEAVAKSSSTYIHIGGDETWALGRGRSLNKTWTFQGPKLYEEHHCKMVEIVKNAGKQPILWGDMISGMYLRHDAEKWAEAIKSDIWKEMLVANWDYSPSSKQHFLDRMKPFVDRGIQQIACPGFSNWRKYYPNFQTATENIRNFLAAAKETGLPGFLVTAWGDDGEECLFSHLEPLLLFTMETAEGTGGWKEKWMALTGETEKVLKARILFGDPAVSENIRCVIYREFGFSRLTVEEKRDLKTRWEKTLKEIENVCLPKDLEFIRQLVETGTRILAGDNVKVSEYIALSKMFSELWLAERKPEGLERIVARFWGAAGKEDLKLFGG